MQTNKEIIKKRFSKKLSSYHQEAVVQKDIAQKLADIFSQIYPQKIQKALEIGCGSGFLTKAILTNTQIENLFLNDIADSAQIETKKILSKLATTNYQFLLGDAEHIDFPLQLDLIFSSSCLHWFNNLQGFFEKAHGHLQKDGVLAFSSFGEYNFEEIKHSLGLSLKYYSLQEQVDLLSNEFEVLKAVEWTEKIHFNSPLDVLKHIRKTGTNALSNKPFGKAQLSLFTEKYLKLFTQEDNTVTLTYHPIIIIAKKK
ncbi:MAG: malonyl-ACP O-methyltransferase BioC [Paludibacteraceae bacterium]|nr:malonyl-ACP O-methyltransferase BioC [Paludibacteraceae bacterium]MBN2788025.1 malonyl-ACP O-methyltransferase BioC [Paludibacteraceae bacterium]